MTANESHVSKSDRRGDDLFSAGEGSEHPHETHESSAATESSPRESLGALFIRVRRERGLDIERCAHDLRLPARVLEKLERDSVEGIDYQVYTRGYLRKYGAYLGIDPARVEAALESSPAGQPELVATGGIPRTRYLLERYAAAATYVVLTGVIIVPLVWLGVNGGLGKQLTQLAPLDSAPVSTPAQAGQTPRSKAQRSPRAARGERPLMASIAPFPALDRDEAQPRPTLARPEMAVPTVSGDAAASSAADKTVGRHSVSLQLSAPSWVEVTTADGQRLEYSLLPAGAHKHYASDQALNVRIGNADAAHVSVDGKPLALGDYRHANVAHFEVHADDGTVSPERG